MRSRLSRVAPLIILGVLAVGAQVAHAEGETLVPDVAAVHVGETVLLTGNFCAEGNTLDALEVTVAAGGPSGPATTTALDPTIATQTVDGFTFLYTTEVDQSAVWFAATCSDASTASSSASPVLVYPTVGLLWWQAPAEGFNGEQGGAVNIGATSIDCVDGSTATAELLVGGTTVSSATGLVAGTDLQFSLPIPAATPAGAHEVFVTCSATAGGQIVDSHPVTVLSNGVGGGGGGVGSGSGSIPVTGPSLQLGLATVILLTGLTLVWFARQAAPTE